MAVTKAKQEMPPGEAEQALVIIPKLRDVEVELGRGKTVAEAGKKTGVTEQTYCGWKKKFGGLKWLTLAALVAGLDDTASGMDPAASCGVSPVGGCYAPPSDIPRGLFPNALVSTATETGKGSLA